MSTAKVRDEAGNRMVGGKKKGEDTAEAMSYAAVQGQGTRTMTSSEVRLSLGVAAASTAVMT